MELNIIKQIKSLRQMLRHKVMPMVEKKIVKKTKKIVKKTEPTKVIVEGRELSLKNVAKNYGLKLATVRARYRVGNRGKLLIRPTQGKKPT